jgi:hypothetical protein
VVATVVDHGAAQALGIKKAASTPPQCHADNHICAGPCHDVLHASRVALNQSILQAKSGTYDSFYSPEHRWSASSVNNAAVRRFAMVVVSPQY